MNKTIVLSNLGGFPFEQNTLEFMQQSYRGAIAALARLCGDKVIITGMDVNGSNISSGWLVYGGEMIPFVGGVLGTQVIITEDVQSAIFEDGSVRNVYYTKTATCGVTGGFPFSDLVRIDSLKTAHESLTALIASFNIHTHAWADITGKPASYIAHTGQQILGDVGGTGTSDSTFTITIPDLGSNSYIVLGSMRSQSANIDEDNDITWAWGTPTANSFIIRVREVSANTQNIIFTYSIIKTA